MDSDLRSEVNLYTSAEINLIQVIILAYENILPSFNFLLCFIGIEGVSIFWSRISKKFLSLSSIAYTVQVQGQAHAHTHACLRFSFIGPRSITIDVQSNKSRPEIVCGWARAVMQN